MSTTTRSAEAAERRFQATLAEYQFMLGYQISTDEAARRAGTTLQGLRTRCERRGLTLDHLADTDVYATG